MNEEIFGLYLSSRRADGVCNNTINGEACTFLSLWRWAAMRRMTDIPLVKPPPRDRRAPQALTTQQVTRLWEAADSLPGSIGKVPCAVYWPAFLNVSWQTAERVGAVLALEWDNIDLTGGWVRYPAHIRKGGRQELVRPINTSAVSRLKVLKEHTGSRPFGVVNRSAWYTHWHALRIVADLPEWAKPHTIRKSHASHLAAAGGDATESLGHATRRMTQDNYLDPTIADNRRNLDLLPDPDHNAPKPSLLGRLFGRK